MKRMTITQVALTTLLLTLSVTPLRVTAQDQRGAEKLRTRKAPAQIPPAAALREALAGPGGEYAARAEYAAVLQKFGNVLPYARIIQAEERHIAALKTQFEKRGLPVPEDTYTGKIQAPDSLRDAARAAVKAEEDNVAMYDKLLAGVKGHPDLEQVFTHLQWASRERHLPVFKALAANDGKLPPGQLAGGATGRQRRGGPPPWAGGRGGGFGRGACCGACWMGPATGTPAGK